jgi:hypothetical protein
MKRTLIFIIVIALLTSTFSIITADSTVTESVSKVASITLDEALKIRNQEGKTTAAEKSVELVKYNEKDGKTIILLEDALKNVEYTDPQIQLYDKKLSLYIKQYSIALDEAVSAKVVADAIDTDMRKKELLNWREKLNVLENAKHDRSNFVFNTKVKFEKSYSGGVQLQNDRATIANELAKLEILINQANLKLKLGLIKSTDINNLNSTKSQIQAQLNSVDRQLETIKKDIKKALTLDNSKDILLIAADKVYSKYNDSTIGDRIKKAAQESYELEKVKRDLDLTKLKYKIVTTYYEETVPAEADSIEASIEEKQHNLKMAALDREAALLKSYYSLKNLEDNIEIQRINVKNAELSLSEIETRIKLNKAIEVDRLTASINLAKANNKLKALVNEYMLSQASINKDLEVLVQK